MRRMLCIIVAVTTAGGAVAEAPVDEHTTFLARYDEGLAADPGPADAEGEGWTLVPGRFGQALQIDEGTVLSYPAEGIINPEQGTIELWVRRWWGPDDEVRSIVVGWQTAANNYLRLNFVNAHRFGVAMNGGAEGATTWHRVDYDPVELTTGPA
ncbi:MAG: hypothetical protein ACLFU7_07455 [Armatimonadota bacterium]